MKRTNLKRISRILLIALLIAFLTSCSVFQQTSEITAFAKCQFRIESARNMKLAGVNIQDKTSASQIGFTDMAKILGSIAKGVLPLAFDLNIQVKNPNPNLAAMNKLDWILLIDDVEMTRGILNQRVEIPANQVTTLPVAMSLDLMKSLSGKSGDALINFAMNLSGNGSRPSRITLKAKPTIYVGSSPIEYPGYITIKQDFGSQ
jgi:hypothetical protein